MYEIIKELCRNKEISVYRLEKDLGLSTGSAIKWEDSIPRGETLLKLANYFNVSIEYLLNQEGGQANE